MRSGCVFLLGYMLATLAWADGRVEGRVDQFNAKNYLSGAIVRIPALGLEAISRSDGRFAFASVPAGGHILEVDYLGFETHRQEITVVDQQVADVSVTLNQAMEEIIVYGQAGSTASALNQQRASDVITSIVSSDEFGQLPDANLSEALQRIPGVFLERDHGEGRFIGIRGIDPNLNVASINGINIPAAESNTRAVALDVIPTDLVETIEVRKSFTPDMDPNGLGGSINVKSLSAFDRKGQFLKLRGEASYNELERQASPRVAATYSDTFSVGDIPDVVGVALALSWSDRTFGADNMETDGGWPGDLETTADVSFQGAEEIEQRNYVVERERTGLALNFDLRPDDNAQYYLRTLFSRYSDREYRTRKEFKFDKGEAVAGSSDSALWNNAKLERELKDRFEEQEILSVSVGGTHWFELWSVDYNYAHSRASEAEPRRIDAEFSIEDVQLGYSSIGATPRLIEDPLVSDAASYELTEITVEDNLTEEKRSSFQFDLEREIFAASFSGAVKFGAKAVRRDKFNDGNIQVYDGFPGNPTLTPFVTGAPDFEPGLFGMGISTSAVKSFIRNNRQQFAVDAGDTLAGSLVVDYDMREDINALYALNRLEAGHLRLVYGLRYEHTSFDARGQRIVFDEVSGAGNAQARSVKYYSDYGFLLPSINLRYKLSDDLILRAAWYQTFARPSFGDLAPGGEVEFEIDDGDNELQVETGNAELRPLEATNFDLTLDYYEQGVGVVSAGVFYKKLEHFIALADVGAEIDLTQFVGSARVDDAEVLQPVNGRKADLLGVELAWVKQWSKLPGPWSGLLTGMNATFTESTAELPLRASSTDLPRQPDAVVNMMVGYENARFSARLAATYTGEALIGLKEPDDPSFDIYEDDHLQVDMSVRFNLNKHWQLYFEGNNLTDEPFYSYFGRSRFNAQYESFGRTYALGIQYNAL